MDSKEDLNLSFGHLAQMIEIELEISQLEAEDTIKDAGMSVLSILPTRPATVRSLAHQKLNAYPFREVPLCWRRVYEESCLWEVSNILSKYNRKTSDKDENEFRRNREKDIWDCMTSVIHLCDLAIIFTGAPKRRHLIDTILESIGQRQKVLHRKDFDTSSWESHGTVYTISAEKLPHNQELRLPARKKQKIDLHNGTTLHNPTTTAQTHQMDAISRGDRSLINSLPTTFPTSTDSSRPIINPSFAIPRVKAPSLETFSQQMHKSHRPLILTNTIEHWPALSKWTSPRYWWTTTHEGSRLVPVELGSSYTDTSWGQEIMLFGRYLRRYVLKERLPYENSAETKSKNRTGYLAQHDLLSQIPALRNDIAIPDYCYLDAPQRQPQQTHKYSEERAQSPPSTKTTISNNVLTDVAAAASNIEYDDHPDINDDAMSSSAYTSTEPMLNIWLGPAGTVSPAHTDPHENILAQVVGRKYVRLFPPSEISKMYPMTKEGCAQEVDEALPDGNIKLKHVNGIETCNACSRDDSDIDNVASSTSANSSKETLAKVEQDSQSVNMQNTSQVDVGAFVSYELLPLDGEKIQSGQKRKIQMSEQRSKFPLHDQAVYIEAILEAGECLYIPCGWWHYISSLDISCSVSFWWD